MMMMMMMMMIKALWVLLGPAGVGKTFCFIAKIWELTAQGYRCVYLTFNRKLQASAQNKLQDTSAEVYTFHMFCYRALKHAGFGEEFDALMRNKQSDETYSLLITKFLDVFSKDGSDFPFTGIDAIFIDEFQNVPADLLPVVKLLAKKIDAEFYVGGDPIQAITHWQSSGMRHFEILKEIFGIEPKYLEPLRINHRSKPGPLMTVNSFLKTQFPKWSESISYILPQDGMRDEDKTKVYIVTSKEKEAELVVEKIKEIRRAGNPSIAVLARNKKQLEVVRAALGCIDPGADEISVSTIHSFIGAEADVVFLIGVEIPEFGDSRIKNKIREEAPDEARVLYVGLSRARERLIIISPCARAELQELLGDGVDIEDLRENTQWEARRIPKVSASRQEQYLTRKRYDLSTIDSIAIKVEACDAPWHPYITDKRPPSKWERQKEFSVDGVSILVKRNVNHGFYIFTLADTNALKRSGFTDRDILAFLKYAIFKFFNAEFSIEKAKVARLDMCRLFSLDDLVIKRIQNDLKNYPMAAVGRDGKIIERSRATADETLYYHIRADYGFQVVFYKPNKKANSNRLYNDDLYKIEVRLRGECLGKRGYSDQLATLGQLEKELASAQDLSLWYWKALRYAGYDNPNARRYTPPKSERFFLQPGVEYDDAISLDGTYA